MRAWANLLLLLASMLSLQSPAGAVEELLPGWQGDTWQSDAVTDNAAGNSNHMDGTAQRAKEQPWIETLSWKPRLFHYHGFLTEEECDYLVRLGEKRVARSMVVDSKTGVSRLDSIRTSYGGAFGRGEDPVISQIELRISEWTHLPPDHGEPIQVLRYENGQEYQAHWDWFNDPMHEKRKQVEGNRYATVLMYLADVEEGGETLFPLADALHPEEKAIPNPSKCAQRMGMAVRPCKGDAVLFFDMDIAGQVGDRKALHASCPTLKGMKWTATCWIHNKPFMGTFDALQQAGKCQDTERTSRCQEAERQGKCDTDPSMVGITGKCRLTCRDCERCPQGDMLCYRRNMRGRRQQQALGGSLYSSG